MSELTKAIAPFLIVASAVIMAALGSLHLLYTFRGPKLLPRDPALRERMAQVSLVISSELTMWNAWVGFNATHSYGAILFGLIYGYLALAHAQFLFASTYLLVIGSLALVGYVFVGRRYFFSVPYRGILLATFLYALGLVLHWT